ncbi:MAG: efflux RND transporter permease subunit [Thermoguttaceae bacterium]
METKEYFSKNVRLGIIVASVLMIPLIVFGALHARSTMSNQVADWLPKEFPETHAFLWYYSNFPEGELLMLSWDGCAVEDERQEKIAEKLLSPTESVPNPYFDKIYTTKSLLKDLTFPPLGLPQKEAISRLKGWLIDSEATQGCMVLLVSREGADDRKTAIKHVRNVVGEIVDLPNDKIYLAGPTIDSVEIDAAAEKTMIMLLPIFMVVCLLLLYLCFRNTFLSFIVFFIALLNSEMGNALIYYTGSHMDSISLLIGSLIFVLSISAGVHIVNYYRECVSEEGIQGAPLRCIKRAFLPCSLACFTTIIGFSSLTVSQVVPIKNFGIYATFVLVLGTGWLLLLLPAILEQFPVKKLKCSKKDDKNLLPCGVNNMTPAASDDTVISSAKTNSVASEQTKEQAEDSLFQTQFDELNQNKHGGTVTEDFSQLSGQYFQSPWRFVAGFVERYHYILAIVGIAIFAWTIFGVSKLKTTVTFHGMFPKNAPVIQNYDYLEHKIGGLIPIEVVLQIPKKSNPDMTALDQFYLVQTLERELVNIPEIEGSVSALNFAPNLPRETRQTASATARRAAINKRLQTEIDRFKQIRFHNEDENDSLWRISLRVPAYKSFEYAPLLTQLNETAKELVENSSSNIQDAKVVICGAVPLVHRTQKQLLTDLIKSFVGAFVLIALTMMVLLKGVLPGLLSMIPNIFPSAVIFGTMGLLGAPVDMGSMMTASVALGIAVDGTLHFLTWFRRGWKDGMNRVDAVRFAFLNCGNALVQTSIICGLGMLVFCVSGFVPISRFSWMLCAMLVVALIGDIIILPAILVGPLGRFFCPKRTKSDQ